MLWGCAALLLSQGLQRDAQLGYKQLPPAPSPAPVPCCTAAAHCHGQCHPQEGKIHGHGVNFDAGTAIPAKPQGSWMQHRCIFLLHVGLAPATNTLGTRQLCLAKNGDTATCQTLPALHRALALSAQLCPAFPSPAGRSRTPGTHQAPSHARAKQQDSERRQQPQ